VNIVYRIRHKRDGVHVCRSHIPAIDLEFNYPIQVLLINPKNHCVAFYIRTRANLIIRAPRRRFIMDWFPPPLHGPRHPTFLA
jgi:hypothetical protein